MTLCGFRVAIVLIATEYSHGQELNTVYIALGSSTGVTTACDVLTIKHRQGIRVSGRNVTVVSKADEFA